MKTTTRIPSDTQIDGLLSKANPKYQLIILLMVDAGLRVSEVVGLQIGNFNFQEKTVSIQQSGSAKVSRVIPISKRIVEALGVYWTKLLDKNPETYLFPPSAQSKQLHLSRKIVYRRIMKYSDGQLSPNLLRQYFAHRVVNHGNDIPTAQLLLGHASTKTTETYLQIEQEKVQTAITSIEERPPLWKRLWNNLLASPKVDFTPVQIGLTTFHIGRRREMDKLMELHQKQVNTLILGPQGIGKSHLLDNFNHGKIIRLDDFRYPKRVLTNLLLSLFDNDKEAILSMLLDLDGKNDLQKVATKESTKRLCELAIEVTKPREYSLIIDDLTDITKIGVRILEKLKNHFHIIASARRIKVELGSFLTNFEKLELPPLNRMETIDLIARLSEPILDRIDDFETYKNRIWEDTQGVPLFVIEMVDRFSKEPLISIEATQSIKHTASKQEIDFSVPLVVAFSSLLVLRYLGGELGENAGAYRLIGGMALVIAFFSRRIFRSLKRKFI